MTPPDPRGRLEPSAAPACEVFAHEIVVRPRDVDAARHLNHVTILAFLEYGRVRAHRDVRQAHPSLPDMPTVVRGLEVEYLSQAALFDVLTVRSWIERDGGSSRTWRQQLVHADGTIVASARVVSVLVDPATGRPRPLDALYRDVFARYRERS